jgi:HAE1 family hydrophobic/amphiphilic exporter-1
MTTFAMVFGMAPVAFSLGEGSEFRSPMGQAVIGGLITSTLLTLFIVPVVYSIIDDLSFRNTFRFLGRLVPGRRSNEGIRKDISTYTSATLEQKGRA